MNGNLATRVEIGVSNSAGIDKSEDASLQNLKIKK